MSSSSQKKTASVTNAIVLLGVLEMNKKEDEFLPRIYPEFRNRTDISAKEFVDIAQLDISLRTVGRYIGTLSEWISEDVEDRILKSGNNGYKSIGEIPYKTKKDFLATFLILRQILTDHIFDSVEELLLKPNEDAFTIITKLYFAIQRRMEVKVKYNPDNKTKLYPDCFIFDMNKWKIKGSNIHENNIKIPVVDIISISL